MAGSARNNTPLKILMTADAAGGVWQYCVDLMAELARYGAQVMLATMGPRPSAEQKRQALSLPCVTLVESDYALEWMSNPWRDVDAAGKWLLDLRAQFQADLIHLNGYAHASLPWARPVIVVAHSCVYSWWRAVHGVAPGDDWSEYKRRVSAGLTASDRVIAPSRSMADAIEREYGVDAAKLRVIHNFSRAPHSARKRKEPFVLGAGRIWDPAKNLELLERLARRVNWEIRIAGDARERGEAMSAARTFHFLGQLPHQGLIKQMDAASIFAHPALYEPFGLSVLEAARARCCLVLADIPSLRELWDGAALFIDPHDDDRWAAWINRLIDHPDERQRLARRAHAHALKYRGSASVRKYWNIYRSLVSSKTGANKGVAA